MGKTAMPIIWFFTKISSVASERLNTPVLNIVVHLEFHSNKLKNLLKSIDVRMLLMYNRKCLQKRLNISTAATVGI